MGKDGQLIHEWVIPGEPGREKEVAEHVARLIENHFSCSRIRLEEMKTAVAEAVLNAMEHGNGMDPHKQVKVRLLHGDAEVIVTTYDEGPGFSFGPPDNERNIWDPEENPRGWGIRLIRSFSDLVLTGRDKGKFFVQMHFSEGSMDDGTTGLSFRNADDRRGDDHRYARGFDQKRRT